MNTGSSALVMGDPPPPTGRKIADEIEREMAERLYPLRNVTLAPAEYHVYLHPDDFACIEGIVPRIVDDVQACLDARVQQLNRRTIWTRITEVERLPPVEVPAGGWQIHIKPSTNDEVSRGEIGIHSRLSVPVNARFGSGAGTVRITETLVAGGERRSRARTEAIPTEQRRAGPATVTSIAAFSPVEAVPPPLPRPIVLSGPRLRYSDDSGEHVHPISKDLTKIGRGGAEHWVDVMISSGPQVSREHCRIRRDAAGRLFLQDVSTWGTCVNGARLDKYVEGDPDSREYELTHGASIRLADAVTLELLLG